MIRPAAKSLQSCLSLCSPIDCSPPGPAVPGILQTRTLEWVAISFSNAWKWKVKVKLLSHVRFLVTPWTAAYQAPPSMGFSRQEYWSGVPLPSPCMQTLRHEWCFKDGNWLVSKVNCNRFSMGHFGIVFLFQWMAGSVQFSHSAVSNSLRPYEPQHARPPCPSPTPGVYPNSYPLSWWYHPTISSSIVPFYSHLQSFPASGSF